MNMNDYISVEALHERLGSDAAPVIVDVRDEQEYRAGHIPGALHIPAGEIPDRLDELPPGRPIVPY